jgi:molybdenum cofactor biosynthesis protein MoaC
MVDITHKPTSLRIAVAEAWVKVGTTSTIEAIRQGTVPKGNVLDFARAAGLLGIKRTSDLIPDCHPVPVESAKIDYYLEEQSIRIVVEVKAIYRTGMEVEAMHGASVVALTLYDMLKPIDKNVSIEHIRLVEKTGGKSNLSLPPTPFSCAILIISDSIYHAKKENNVGEELQSLIRGKGFDVQHTYCIPDDSHQIQTIIQQCVNSGVALILTAGGTGLTSNDITPDVIRPMLTREIPGMAEFMRAYGTARTFQAVVSRGIAGFIGNTLIVTLPGTVSGAIDSFHSLKDGLIHVLSERNKNEKI